MNDPVEGVLLGEPVRAHIVMLRVKVISRCVN